MDRSNQGTEGIEPDDHQLVRPEEVAHLSDEVELPEELTGDRVEDGGAGVHDVSLMKELYHAPSSEARVLEAEESRHRDPERLASRHLRPPPRVGRGLLLLPTGDLPALLHEAVDHRLPLLGRPVLGPEPAGADVVDLLVDVRVDPVELDLDVGGVHVVLSL